jgi:hypothetical protein
VRLELQRREALTDVTGVVGGRIVMTALKNKLAPFRAHELTLVYGQGLVGVGAAMTGRARPPRPTWARFRLGLTSTDIYVALRIASMIYAFSVLVDLLRQAKHRNPNWSLRRAVRSRYGYFATPLELLRGLLGVSRVHPLERFLRIRE